MGVVETSYVCTLIVLIIIIVNLPYIFIVNCFVLPWTDHWQGEAGYLCNFGINWTDHYEGRMYYIFIDSLFHSQLFQ